MKVKDILAIDRTIVNMTYEKFIEWREDGYMTYLIDSSKEHNISRKRVNGILQNEFSIDIDVLDKFNSGEYDKVDYIDAILATLKAVTRYILVELESSVLDHKSYIRDKNINNIIS